MNRSDLAIRLASAALPGLAGPDRLPVAWAAADVGVRRFCLDLWSACLDAPHEAGPLLSQSFRKTRSLGSRGRRLAASVLYGLIRHEAILGLLLEAVDAPPADPLARYLGWLVRVEGLDPELAARELPGPAWGRLADAPSIVAARCAHLDPVDGLALGGSLPRWVAEEWLAALGEESADLVHALSERPPMVVRTNLCRNTREELARRLAAEGVPARPGPHAPAALVFEDRRNVHLLPSFREGRFEVQDEGSQLVARLVGAAPGVRVVDACAGAGGKALALADAGAEVWALDVRAPALADLAWRSTRAGVPVRVDLVRPDGPLPVPRGWADVVLADVPCSGSGTLRRHPEVRWRLHPSRVQGLAAEQAGILARTAPLVRPGGALVYATCSLLAMENQDVVAGFLDRHPDFSRGACLGEDGVLWPHRAGTDGFFAVRLERR
ncbi:MAG: RsmB/NOP family class I SAM-dependent RNA methyltransferase [Deltaproteobacteria bacterium]|nr:RsmB/NOP family class I SAM-dependent RNA methyltransferase [Deltaproteobacteria bacterium]